MTDIIPEILIGGKSIPILGFEIHMGANGHIGSAKIDTTRQMLRDANIDMLQLVSNPGPVETIVNITAETGGKVRIFGGEYMAGDWAFDSDQIRLTCRDWAGPLVDEKKVLASVAGKVTSALGGSAPGGSSGGVNTQNQTVGSIVTQIANMFGLTPVLHLQDNNPIYGALYGSDDTVYMTIPQSLWAVLVQLAKDTGNELYVTPNKELVFGTAGAGLPHQDISYNQSPLDAPVSSRSVPCRNLHVQHNPRRNASFRVIVFSYDPAKKQTVQGKAVVISPSMAGANGLSAGVSTGNGANEQDTKLAALANQKGAGANVNIPLYSFHVDGLTAEQANAKAAALAEDISKRELIMHAEMDGLSNLRPTQIFKLSGQVDEGFKGQTYFVSSFIHYFRMPGRGASTGRHGNAHLDGYMTQIHCLNRPTEGSGGKQISSSASPRIKLS